MAVHCKAGMGRTGTMLACYLVRFEGARPDEAIERVRAARPGSIETAEQERTVTEYYQFLQSLTNNSIWGRNFSEIVQRIFLNVIDMFQNGP